MKDEDHPGRHPAVETAVLGAEAVLYDERSGMVHHLNSSACAIWVLLDGRPVGEVVRALSQATGMAPDDMRENVLGTVRELGAVGLLAD